MKTLFKRTAYLLVLIAMTLLMSESIVPHHHCEEVTQHCHTVKETIHFGYGKCEECTATHGDSQHEHSESHCCDDTKIYIRTAGNDAHVEKRFVAHNSSCFILNEQPVIYKSHTCSSYSCYCQLKIPDIGIPDTPLRAPPFA